LVHRAIGDRLHCVFVDNGLLRYKEQERVMDMFKEHLHLPVTCIDASERMLNKLQGLDDPEKKRKAIGGLFIRVFEDFSTQLEKDIGQKPSFLVQGTLYPDVIESCPPPGSDRKHSHKIKSHHNVGGLPEDLQFTLIEPLRWLFKDEVRKLGALLDVPSQFLKRHPFPGPGLAVRVLGDVTQGNALDVLREADEIFIECIKDFGLYDKIWQAFAVFLPIRSVGVQGDQRTHSHVIALRAVCSGDGMTADWYPFDASFLKDLPDMYRVDPESDEYVKLCKEGTTGVAQQDLLFGTKTPVVQVYRPDINNCPGPKLDDAKSTCKAREHKFIPSMGCLIDVCFGGKGFAREDVNDKVRIDGIGSSSQSRTRARGSGSCNEG